MADDDSGNVEQIKKDIKSSADYDYNRSFEALTVAEAKLQLADSKFMDEYKKLANDHPNIKSAEVSKENPETADEMRIASEQSRKAESELKANIARIAGELGHDGSRKPYNSSDTETAHENELNKSALPKAQDELVKAAREAGQQEAKVASRAIEDSKPEIENYTARLEAMHKNGSDALITKYDGFKKEFQDRNHDLSDRDVKDLVMRDHPELAVSKDLNNYIDAKLALESKVHSVLPDQYQNYSTSGFNDQGKRVVEEIERGAQIDAKHNAKSSEPVALNTPTFPDGHPLANVDPEILAVAAKGHSGQLPTDGKTYDQNTRNQAAIVGTGQTPKNRALSKPV